MTQECKIATKQLERKKDGIDVCCSHEILGKENMHHTNFPSSKNGKKSKGF